MALNKAVQLKGLEPGDMIYYYPKGNVEATIGAHRDVLRLEVVHRLYPDIIDVMCKTMYSDDTLERPFSITVNTLLSAQSEFFVKHRNTGTVKDLKNHIFHNAELTKHLQHIPFIISLMGRATVCYLEDITINSEFDDDTGVLTNESLTITMVGRFNSQSRRFRMTIDRDQLEHFYELHPEHQKEDLHEWYVKAQLGIYPLGSEIVLLNNVPNTDNYVVSGLVKDAEVVPHVTAVTDIPSTSHTNDIKKFTNGVTADWKLYIDDERMPPDGTWFLAHTAADAIRALETYGLPRVMSLDYDLRPDVGGGRRNVMEFVNYMRNTIMDRNLVIPADFEFVVHSTNRRDGERLHQLMDELVTEYRVVSA